MAEAVNPGTTWRRVGGNYGSEPVLVMRVSSTGNVQARRRDGKTWSIPLEAFMVQYIPLGGAPDPHMCGRCGSSTLRSTDKYCKDCQAAIARFRNAKREEDPVLTTTNPKLIEQRKQDEKAAPQASSQPAPQVPPQHWRIRGRVVLELYVDGATAIDALGAAEGEYPGMIVTEVHMMDGVSD